MSVVDEMSSNDLRINKFKTDPLVYGGEERGNDSRGSQHFWWIKGRNLPSTFSTQIMTRTLHSLFRRYPVQASVVLPTA
jgi:hypothetical protein